MKYFAPFLMVLLAMVFISCNGQSYSNQPSNVTVVQASVDADTSGLDLRAVGELAKNARNADDLERTINASGGINNLDLEHTGSVNYVNVTEYRNGNQYGFKLTTQLRNGSSVQLADIQITPTGNNSANVAISGNQNYYGSNYYYESQVSNMLLLSWLLMPHPMYYHTGYYYGHYPSYYRSYPVVSRNVYTQRTSTVTRTTTYTKPASYTKTTTNTQPAAAKAAPAPATSQKSFQARDTSKKVGSGGFGKSSPSSGSRSSSTRKR